MKIKLTKLSAVENPRAETAGSVQEYRDSLSLWDGYGKSPSVDYWVTGELVNEPEVGVRLCVNRDNRNGVEITGIMFTTTIKSIEKFEGYDLLKTENSVYKLECL